MVRKVLDEHKLIEEFKQQTLKEIPEEDKCNLAEDNYHLVVSLGGEYRDKGSKPEELIHWGERGLCRA